MCLNNDIAMFLIHDFTVRRLVSPLQSCVITTQAYNAISHSVSRCLALGYRDCDQQHRLQVDVQGGTN